MKHELIEDGDSRILLVDDDPMGLEVATLLLTEYGYPAVTADNAVDALAKVRDQQIAAVVTDVKMPGVTGLKLLEEIRKLNPEIPVILMTGHA